MNQAISQVGPYVVEGEIGRGGMGVVYRAHDSRLGRAVAIKALPEHLAQDAERLSRFEREARTLASLSHPNIAAIHGLEVDGPHRYLVLEFIEGETLSSLIERAPLPVDEALQIGAQIAEALEAAHEKGVVHRDLKPGNVIITPEGVAKVLDFGLARTGEGPASSSRVDLSPDSPTIERPSPVHSPTIPGAIMGTAGYMSPEQARGRAVDKRSDIFSFGCVLYEMLTGIRPFAGDTVADVLGATLHKELDLSLLPASTPPRVRELLATCLEKDRRNRLHDMGDARIALRKAIDGREWTHTHHAATEPNRSSPWPVVALGAVGAVALAGAAWYAGSAFSTKATRAPTLRMVIPSSTPQYTQADSPVISPDGERIVFRAVDRATDRVMLWVRRLDAFDATPIPETRGAFGTSWSWDSRSIVFHAEGRLWAVDLDAGGARRLLAAERSSAGIAWNSRGEILFSYPTRKGVIGRLAPGSGAAVDATAPDTGAVETFQVFPHFLSDDERFLFLKVSIDPEQEVRTGRLMLGRLGSTEVTELGPMLSAVWYAEPGWLVYVEDGSIKAAPFDERSARITGESVTIGDDAFYFKAYGASSLSVSRNGTVVFQPPSVDGELVWFGADGSRLGTVGPKGSIDDVRLSPDGSRAAVAVADRRTAGSDIWVYGTDRPSAMRLTTDARWEGAPVWSHDGSTVYFSHDKFDAPWIYSISSDGSGEFKEVYGRDSGGSVWYVTDVSRDGTRLLMNGSFDRLGSELRILDLTGSREARAFQSTPAGEGSGRFSPDGKWVAFSSDRSGRFEIYLAPSDGSGRVVQVSENGGSTPQWANSGNALFYLARPSGKGAGAAPDAGTALMVVDLTTPEAFRAPPAPRMQFTTPQTISSFAVAPDDKRFLAEVDPSDTPMIRVIVNALPERH